LVDPVIWYPGYDLPLRNIVKAQNCSLYDEQGKRYVDLESGVWCTSVGHGNARVLRALTEQAARIAHTGYAFSSKVVAEAAQEVLRLHGFEQGKCTFLCSGSEAVEFGVRVAREVSTRPLLMTMADSYFGAYGAASTKREGEWFCFDWMECAECTQSACGRHCERWAGIPFDEIAAFLFEPGSSSGLVRFPPLKLIQAIVSELKANGGLVLVNEVTTGVGRTGKWFGYQHYDFSPDMVAMGKGIGNGYPVAVAAFSAGLIERLGGRPVRYAQSHQNDPLGAAVALEVVRVIEDEGLIERAGQISALLVGGLQAIRQRTDTITAVRARGLMVALELRDDAAASFTASVQQELLHNGYIVAQRPGANVLRIDPSLTIERSDVEDFLALLEDVLTR
jgi:acetylornithine/N-succinyldiaminopimelate aminotransferase